MRRPLVALAAVPALLVGLATAPASAAPRPAAPTNVVAWQAGPNPYFGITVSWQGVTSKGVEGYRIFRGCSSGTEKLYDVANETGDFDSWTNDQGVVAGQTYFYRVAAFTAKGTGALSAEVSATAEGTLPAPGQPAC